MNEISTIEESYRYCEAFAHQKAKNFYYAVQLLPKNKRKALYPIYTWMATIDKIIDNEKSSIKTKTKHWQAFKSKTLTIFKETLPATGKLWPAFQHSIKNHQLPEHYFMAMLDGQWMDLKNRRYKTFEALYRYCYNVASTVGLICIHIWGYHGGKKTQQLAEWRGIAFQLTNILRDVQEDHQYQRYYLPGAHPRTKNVLPTIDALIQITEKYYQKSQALEKYINQDSIMCLQAMTAIYYAIFLKIKRCPQKVLRKKRIKLSTTYKWFIIIKFRFLFAFSSRYTQ